MPTLMQAIKRLRDRWILPPSDTVSVKDLIQRFHPVPPGSMRSLLLKMGENLAEHSVGSSIHPYYRRAQPSPHRYDTFADISFGDGTYVDFSDPRVHLMAFGEVDAVTKAAALFDHRAAALLHAARGLEDDNFWVRVSLENPLRFDPPQKRFRGLLAQTKYDDAPDVWSPTTKCLALLAYADYFRGGRVARSLISEAVIAANPGWCGTFGPGVDSAIDVATDPPEGNYDFEQMHLIPMAYRYFDELTPEAQEHLITALLARGTIHGPGQDDTHTSGPYPDYWSRAGKVLGKRIGETENHILMIMTTRYLANQLLYQRNPTILFDNRRNSPSEIVAEFSIVPQRVVPHKEPSPGSCAWLMLSLLQGMLTDDFSEYNAKPYQRFTRYALLNLCTYAYDHEVRLAARMVLDYVSAHFAISSNDLRRLVPFRRRNEGALVAHDPQHGFMTTGILEWQDGADSTGRSFAILAGNMRAFQSLPFVSSDGTQPDRMPTSWSIRDNGEDQVLDVLSDYRLPPSIHALFVNDSHRRFYQRLHRFRRGDETENRNCDNMELYAGSPSYLITAGGAPATYAIDPRFLGFVVGGSEATTKQLGVAVTTSFMPTTRPNLDCGDPARASDLIQFSRFSDDFDHDSEGFPKTNSYGVAPDFACGYGIHLPDWVRVSADPPFGDAPGFHFVNRGSDGSSPGFYLAIYKDGDYACLEAFDTWLHHDPQVSFDQFKRNVLDRNGTISLRRSDLNGEQGALYTTQNGTQVNFLIWQDHTDFARPDSVQGAKVSVQYGAGDPTDRIGDAGNVTDPFLNGTVLNSRGQGKIEISNPFFGNNGSTITLDMSDVLHPRRTSETEEVEEAGSNHEVWVDFGWTGPNEGDFFRPFNTITAAAAAVADGGAIKIVPGWTTEKPVFQRNKRIRLVAPIGNVTFGVR